jgi:hypothetical protein
MGATVWVKVCTCTCTCSAPWCYCDVCLEWLQLSSARHNCGTRYVKCKIAQKPQDSLQLCHLQASPIAAAPSHL